jgi:hypothetical protein
VTIAIADRIAPKNPLAAWGRKVIPRCVSPPIITMSHAMASGQ